MVPECPIDTPYDGLKQLLPKLAQPSWVHLIGLQIQKPVILPPDKKAAKKDAIKRYKAYKRFITAVRGDA